MGMDVDMTGGPLGAEAMIDRLPPAYRVLYDRAVTALEPDERVRALWLGGSLARGTVDAASDLDLLVTVDDEAYEAYVADWRGVVGAITPTVLANEVPFTKGIIHAVAEGHLRIDLVIEPVSSLSGTFHPDRLVVFDRDGVGATVAPLRPPAGPDAGTVLGLITEFYRASAMPECIVERDDLLLSALHCHHLRSLLYSLWDQAAAPRPMMGVKRWKERYTPEQQATMLALPTMLTSVAELGAAHQAFSRAFLASARPLAARLAVDWPETFAASCADHVRAVLGLDDPYPEA